MTSNNPATLIALAWEAKVARRLAILWAACVLVWLPLLWPNSAISFIVALICYRRWQQSAAAIRAQAESQP